MKNVITFLGLLMLSFLLVDFTVATSELKCIVCRQVVNEITSTIAKVDSRKTIQVGSFRIQPDGSQKQAEIKYAGSEVHLNEILETVCNAMEDYVQAKHKETGELALLNLSVDINKLSTYDLVPDPDLNRSLKYYCESFIEDYEDDIIGVFKGSGDADISSSAATQLCQASSGYCSSKHAEL